MTKFDVLCDLTIEDFIGSFHVGKENLKKILGLNFLVNGVKPSLNLLKKGDVIEFDLSLLDNIKMIPYEYNLDIVYEDSYIIIINKPVGILVHPDGIRNDTLANAVYSYYLNSNQDASVKLNHRLDYDTSGLIIFSKDILSQSYINYQIESKQFKKEYIAIVEGNIIAARGTLDFPIGRNRHDSRKYLVSKTGKAAITKYEVISRAKDRTKVKIDLKTGRTHQIRVHFQYLNHPIVGDPLYGKSADRMYLHASKISFIHPNSRKLMSARAKPKGEEKWIL